MAKFKSIGNVISKHSPEILTGVGIAGMLTTTVMAVKATPKALILIEEEKRRQNKILFDEAKKAGKESCARVDHLKPVDVIKTTWKCYIPSAVTGVSSVVCLVGASSINLKRNTAIAAAYKISETALTEFKEATGEVVGQEKIKEIEDKLADKQLEKNPHSTANVLVTGNGDALCYDAYSGRYFTSTVEKIRKAENILNRRLMDENYMSLNEFYDELDLEHVAVGNSVGWNIYDGMVELYFNSRLTDDDKPAVVVIFDTPPKHGYSHFS